MRTEVGLKIDNKANKISKLCITRIPRGCDENNSWEVGGCDGNFFFFTLLSDFASMEVGGLGTSR